MSRTAGGILLLAMVLSLPFVSITVVHCASGEAIAALDVCSAHSQATASDLSTLVEPFFEVLEFNAPAGFSEFVSQIRQYMLSSQVDKPPQA